MKLLQDPHNQYLYLWAAGGLLLLGSFVLLLLVYLRDSWRRFRAGTIEDRRLVFWAASVWFVFVANSAVGIVLTAPQTLLTFCFVDQILPAEFGFPMKLRIPTKLGFKNPKHIAAIFVTNEYPGGYWEDQGYNWYSGS